MTRRILMLGLFSLQNAGDNAILRASVSALKKAFPQASVTVALHDRTLRHPPESDLHFVGEYLSWITRITPERGLQVYRWRWFGYVFLILLNLLGYRLGKKQPLFFRDPEKRALIQAYLDADLIVACGGGYLYESRKYSPWFIGICFGLALAIWLDKPLIFLPQSLGPLPGALQRSLLKWLVQRARLVLVRDEQSWEFLQNIGARGNFRRCPDMAFAQETAAPALVLDWLKQQGLEWLPGSFTVGLTALNWDQQFTTFRSAQQVDYESALAQLCDHFIARGCRVVFFPQTSGPIEAHDDRLAAQRIRQRLLHPEGFILLTQQPPPDILQAAYGCCRLFVATRMHSLIFAFNSGAPAIGIGYLHKMIGVLRWLDWQDWYFDITALSGVELIERCEELLRQRENLLPLISERRERLRQQFAALPAMLQDVLK